MTDVFLKVLNMSLAAGLMIPAVMLVRLLLKKAPKWISVLLWAAVAVRLCVPFTLESRVSLVPSGEVVSPEIMTDPTPEIRTGISAVNSVVNPLITESFSPSPGDSVNPLGVILPLEALIWASGAAAMLLYALLSRVLLGRRMKTAVRLGDRVFQSERVDSPFVLGMFRPRIYVPFGMEGEALEFVIAHERSHISRGDHVWKPLGWLVLSFHWFNPLVWAAYALFCRDIELACDERVISKMEPRERADYSEALLGISAKRALITACPLAFGEVGVKSRVRSVLSYKKPGFWVIVGALVICVGVAVFFWTERPGNVEHSPKTPLSETVSGYTPETAREEGCVILDGHELLYGEELWTGFVKTAQSGKEAYVRIYQAYSEEARYYVKDLSFDGRSYRLRMYDRKGDTGELFLSDEEYLFLVRDFYSPFSDVCSECYLLADSENVTAEDYWGSMLLGVMTGPDVRCRPVYQRRIESEGYLESFYDTVFFDVDGDGRFEKCCLGMGRTSGVFSFTVSVYGENGKKTAEGGFVTAWYSDLEWETENGRLYIRAVSESSSDLYGFEIKRGKIVLENGGEPLSSLEFENQYRPEDVPEGFGFSLVWNTFGQNSYDSRTGRLVKTTNATHPEDYVTEMFFSPEDMRWVYTAVQNMDLSVYPNSYDPFNAPDAELVQMVTPSQNLVLTVWDGGKVVKRIECMNVLYFGMAEGYDDAAKDFVALCRGISERVYASSEWKALPEYEFFYE